MWQDIMARALRSSLVIQSSERESTLENNEQLNSMETSLKLKNVVIEWIHMPVLTKGTEESVIKPNYSVTKFASLYSTNHLLKIKSWLLFSF